MRKNQTKIYNKHTSVVIRAGAESHYGKTFEVDTPGKLERDYQYGYEVPVRLDEKRVVLVLREFVQFP
jgi:hypothetical protein